MLEDPEWHQRVLIRRKAWSLVAELVNLWTAQPNSSLKAEVSEAIDGLRCRLSMTEMAEQALEGSKE